MLLLPVFFFSWALMAMAISATEVDTIYLDQNGQEINSFVGLAITREILVEGDFNYKIANAMILPGLCAFCISFLAFVAGVYVFRQNKVFDVDEQTDLYLSALIGYLTAALWAIVGLLALARFSVGSTGAEDYATVLGFISIFCGIFSAMGILSKAYKLATEPHEIVA